MAGKYPTSAPPLHPKPPENPPLENQPSCRKNPFSIVAKIAQDSHELRANLIKLTEKLAEDARNGTLKGLGGFYEYDDGYGFGLEGSYLQHPEAAILPLKRLERRIIDDVEAGEEN